jgi:predicted ArsR family transcriptional regulator
MGADERQRWVESRAQRFPNARPDFEEVSAQRVRFRIHRCRFVQLAQAIGEPRLATVFCRADERYFGGVAPGVELVRPHTLAQGGPDCPFELRFAER